MITVTLEDVRKYVETLDPDMEFFADGYSLDCPVARYGYDVLGYDNAYYTLGKYLGGSYCKVQIADDLRRYVIDLEEKYKIGHESGTLTAKEFLDG